MIETIRRCDRCKKKCDELIDVRMLNLNHEAETKKPEMESQFFDLFISHPALKKELCFDCTKHLLHWLGHSENVLIKEKIDG